MDLKKVLLMILMVVFVDGDCLSGVQNCLNTYMQQLISHLGSGDALCNDTDVYIKCVFNQGCNIGTSQKQAMIDTTKDTFDGMNCSFTLTDLINRYGNSASVLSSVNTIFILITGITLFLLI